MNIGHKTPCRKRAIALMCAFVVLAALGSPVHAGSSAASDVARLPFTVDFDGLDAVGELTYPAGETGPFPTVVLVHGSGPADMDFTMTDFDPTTGMPSVRSAIFADIAETLSKAGFAVARFNKRYVQGPGDADVTAYMANVTMHTLAADVETVVEHVQTHSLVDNDRIFLYGWSEGSVIAAHVAAERSDVVGLIVQAPVVSSYKDMVTYQMRDVGMAYLRHAAKGGPVTDDTLAAMAKDTDVGPAAQNILNYVADAAAFQAGQIAVSGLLDGNSDGELDIDGEIVPALDTLVDFALSPMGTFAMYGSGRGLPVLIEQADAVNVPVLILQGEEDGHVPPSGAGLLAGALKEAGVNATLHTYDGLGHSLGPATSPVHDTFTPIAAEPLADVAAWLKSKTK